MKILMERSITPPDPAKRPIIGIKSICIEKRIGNQVKSTRQKNFSLVAGVEENGYVAIRKFQISYAGVLGEIITD